MKASNGRSGFGLGLGSGGLGERGQPPTMGKAGSVFKPAAYSKGLAGSATDAGIATGTDKTTGSSPPLSPPVQRPAVSDSPLSVAASKESTATRSSCRPASKP